MSAVASQIDLSQPMVHQRLSTKHPYHTGEWTYLNHYCSKRNDINSLKLFNRAKHWWKTFMKIGAVFVHIPKNAGTSVEFFLEERLASFDNMLPRSQHFTALELQRQWPNKFHAMPSFAVVRDPIDRFLSAFNYVSNGGNGGDIDRQCARRLNNRTPNWFINTVLSRSLDFITHLPISGFWSLCAHNASSEDYLRAGIPVHFVPQSIFVSDATNNIIVTHMYTIDDINSGKCYKEMYQHVEKRKNSGGSWSGDSGGENQHVDKSGGVFPLWDQKKHSEQRRRVTKNILKQGDGCNEKEIKIWTRKDMDIQMVSRLREIYVLDVKLFQMVSQKKIEI